MSFLIETNGGDNILDFILSIFSLIVGVVFLIGLFFIVNKISNANIGNSSTDKFVNILEKTPIAKDTYILVVKIGEDSLVILQTPTSSTVVKTLASYEVKMVTDAKKNSTYKNITNKQSDKLSKLLNGKAKRK